jgi:hypothetical protein
MLFDNYKRTHALRSYKDAATRMRVAFAVASAAESARVLRVLRAD